MPLLTRTLTGPSGAGKPISLKTMSGLPPRPVAPSLLAYTATSVTLSWPGLSVKKKSEDEDVVYKWRIQHDGGTKGKTWTDVTVDATGEGTLPSPTYTLSSLTFFLSLSLCVCVFVYMCLYECRYEAYCGWSLCWHTLSVPCCSVQ